MTPGARLLVEYLAELLAREALEREAQVDQPAAEQQNAPEPAEQEG